MILALTLWRPWAWAIVHGGKDVENRCWAPPAALIGKAIAIHAGKTYDKEAAEDVAELLELDALPPEAAHEGIVGVVTIDRVIRGGLLGQEPGTPAGDPALSSDWYRGPVGWVLRSPLPLKTPVPCPGRQKLWAVPPDIEAEVRRQLAAKEPDHG